MPETTTTQLRTTLKFDELPAYQRQIAEALRAELPPEIGFVPSDRMLARLVQRVCLLAGDQLLEVTHHEYHGVTVPAYIESVRDATVERVQLMASSRHLGLLQEVEVGWEPEAPGASSYRGPWRLTATTYGRPLARPS